MSDAQLPPDTGDEESAPPHRWGTHLNDAGVLVAVRLDASDDAAPQGAPISLPEVIEGEAERMAEIVRKIGKITRYETKSYVGTTKIVDIDAASGDDPEASLPQAVSATSSPVPPGSVNR